MSCYGALYFPIFLCTTKLFESLSFKCILIIKACIRIKKKKKREKTLDITQIVDRHIQIYSKYCILI